MNKYDYRAALCADIKDWIIENGVLEQAHQEDWTHVELYEWLYDELWQEDCITGNGAYGYVTEEECAQYVASNFPLYFEAANEFYDFPTPETPWVYKEPARHMDATIRCYLLGECIDTTLEEMNE